jgi:hypothetical protein
LALIGAIANPHDVAQQRFYANFLLDRDTPHAHLREHIPKHALEHHVLHRGHRHRARRLR